MSSLRLISLAATISLPGFSADLLPLSDPSDLGGWDLVESVSDEFNADSLDDEKWFNLGHEGNYHGEWKGRAPSQYNPENISLKDGFLILTSKWDPDFEFSDEPFNGVPYGKAAPVTTAAIVSQKKFHYGYLEMRCKAADGPISSSFWTTGSGGEIDVFEHFGSNPNQANSAYRYHTSLHDWRKGSETFGKRIWTNDHLLEFRVADDFHVYGLEWSPLGLSTFIDGRLINTTTREELGDRWVAGNEQKIWIDSETFDWEMKPEQLKASHFGEDSKFIVDYCRVWQRTEPATPEGADPFQLANAGFEDGLEFWNGSGEISDDAHSGMSAASLPKAGKIQRTFAVKPSTTYVLSAWAKSPATDMKSKWYQSYLNVAAYGGPKRSLSFSLPSYHRKSLDFTTGPDSETATIFFTNEPQGMPAFVDDFQIMEFAPPSK